MENLLNIIITTQSLFMFQKNKPVITVFTILIICIISSCQQTQPNPPQSSINKKDSSGQNKKQIEIKKESTEDCFTRIKKHTIFYDGDYENTSINPNEISSKDLPIAQRLGCYHFGLSEWEWDMCFTGNTDNLQVEVKYVDIIKGQFLHKTKKFTCKISGNVVFFDKYTCVFAEQIINGQAQTAILISGRPQEKRNYKDSCEIGWGITLPLK